MGDPACWLHLLDEDGRMPDPVAEEEEDAETARPPGTAEIPPLPD